MSDSFLNIVDPLYSRPIPKKPPPRSIRFGVMGDAVWVSVDIGSPRALGPNDNTIDYIVEIDRKTGAITVTDLDNVGLSMPHHPTFYPSDRNPQKYNNWKKRLRIFMQTKELHHRPHRAYIRTDDHPQEALKFLAEFTKPKK